MTFKSFESKTAAEQWIQQPPVPYRTADTPHEKDVIYLYVDGSFSSKRNISGWGWVAVKNDKRISENYGYLDNLYGSRNIVGELTATQQGVASMTPIRNGLPIVVVHDYIGIANWALGYWAARKEVAIEYKHFMRQFTHLIESNQLRFEKVSGHKDIKWNDYADELTRKGYPD